MYSFLNIRRPVSFGEIRLTNWCVCQRSMDCFRVESSRFNPKPHKLKSRREHSHWTREMQDFQRKYAFEQRLIIGGMSFPRLMKRNFSISCAIFTANDDRIFKLLLLCEQTVNTEFLENYFPTDPLLLSRPLRGWFATENFRINCYRIIS